MRGTRSVPVQREAEIKRRVEGLAREAAHTVLASSMMLDKTVSDYAGDYYVLSFLSAYLGGVVNQCLHKHADSVKSREEQAEEVMGAFRELKHNVQEAIGAGFAGGMSSFSGREIEYYCKINAIPEAPSKSEN